MEERLRKRLNLLNEAIDCFNSNGKLSDELSKRIAEDKLIKTVYQLYVRDQRFDKEEAEKGYSEDPAWREYIRGTEEMPEGKHFSDERDKIYDLLREANADNADLKEKFRGRSVRSWAKLIDYIRENHQDEKECMVVFYLTNYVSEEINGARIRFNQYKSKDFEEAAKWFKDGKLIDQNCDNELALELESLHQRMINGVVLLSKLTDEQAARIHDIIVVNDSYISHDGMDSGAGNAGIVAEVMKNEDGTYKSTKGDGVPRMQYGTYLNEYGHFGCITTGTYRWEVNITEKGVFLLYSPGWAVDDTLPGWSALDEDNG